MIDDVALITATAQRTYADAFGPFVDADTLGTLLERVAEIPYPGDLERYAAVLADTARTTLQPFIDRVTRENAEWRAASEASAQRARAFEEFWLMKTSSTIQ